MAKDIVKLFLGRATMRILAGILMVLSLLMTLDVLGYIKTNLVMQSGVIVLSIGLVTVSETLFEAKRTKIGYLALIQLSFAALAIIIGLGGVLGIPSIVTAFAPYNVPLFIGWTVILAREMLVDKK